MTFEKFTIKAQEAVQSAINIAQRNGQQTIEPVHILAGVMDKGKDVINYVFQKIGVNAQAVESAIQNEMSHLPKVSGGEPYLSSETNQVMQRTIETSQKMGDEFVSIEPMLLALLAVNSTASRILKDAGCTEKEMTAAINDLRQGQKVQSQSGDENYQSLQKYARNLIEDARAGKLDPVIGRDEEIRRVLQILSAKPSTIAVLPVPGSPMRIGLFFVRRERICNTLRISSSRPITGSSFPARASSIRLRAYFCND